MSRFIYFFILFLPIKKRAPLIYRNGTLSILNASTVKLLAYNTGNVPFLCTIGARLKKRAPLIYRNGTLSVLNASPVKLLAFKTDNVPFLYIIVARFFTL